MSEPFLDSTNDPVKIIYGRSNDADDTQLF